MTVEQSGMRGTVVEQRKNLRNADAVVCGANKRPTSSAVDRDIPRLQNNPGIKVAERRRSVRLNPAPGMRGAPTTGPGLLLPCRPSLVFPFSHRLSLNMGTTNTIPVVVQEAELALTKQVYHHGSVVRAVSIALGIIILLELVGVACKHYGTLRCLTGGATYNNGWRDSYFMRYISCGWFQVDTEITNVPPVFLQVPPAYVSPQVAKVQIPVIQPGLSSTEQFVRL